MTIICYKDGIMAADSAVFYGNEGIIVGHVKKIVRGPLGSLGAASGAALFIQKFVLWLEAGQPTHEPPIDCDKEDFGGYFVQPSGEAFFVDNKGNVSRYSCPIFAAGYAQTFALGAMMAGASAEHAVRTCISVHDGCGGEVQVEHLRQASVRAA